MAATALTVTVLDQAGVAPGAGVAADVANGNSVANNGTSTFLVADNTDGAEQTVTVVTSATVEGLAVADRTHTIAAGAKVWIKLGSRQVYGRNVTVTSSSASVKLSAYVLS